MTSSSGLNLNLYVWVILNGEAVVVGKAETAEGVGSFYYANSYIDRANSFAIDPINLPLIKGKTFTTTANRGAFGVLLDAGPDAWGKKVLSYVSEKRPKSDYEYLLASNGHGNGALLFSNSPNAVETPLPGSDETASLDYLEQSVWSLGQLNLIKPLPANLERLLAHNSSMGGARPKATLLLKGEPHLAKFSTRTDQFSQARAEAATLQMARDSGIEVPDFSIVAFDSGREALLLKRFDFTDTPLSTGLVKAHYISAHSLMNLTKVSPDSPQSGYPYLASLMQQFCKSPKKEIAELYKRMSFRVLVGDTDDHAKNYGFLYSEGGYRSSPFFDTLPHPMNTQAQAMPIGNMGRERSLENLLSATSSFGLTPQEALNIICAQAAVLSDWKERFEKARLTRIEIEALSGSMSLIKKTNELSPQEKINLLAAARRRLSR